MYIISKGLSASDLLAGWQPWKNEARVLRSRRAGNPSVDNPRLTAEHLIIWVAPPWAFFLGALESLPRRDEGGIGEVRHREDDRQCPLHRF